MKITLAPTQTKEITALRAQLAAALAAQTTAGGELQRLENKQVKLTAEIADLEAADSESEAAASALATKRVQLESVTKKISAFDNEPAKVSVSRDQENGELLKKFARASAAATGPAVTDWCRQYASKIRDCFQDDDAALRCIVYSTPAGQSLIGLTTYPFGQNSRSALEIKYAIARADELLAGELKWLFDAKK